ncbi:hypothetical protein [Jannaschia ovalis]|uniref:Uncharacterized protein n=1 Tax=Jannaschia ovalis TaxID=3038773 RepID=A0ABY8LFP1_9RHOB|nr:hypothetical protein [Jannaschia sp. GRR-S6-38]WGH80091.1 hypothetical protein P8627_07455 [Jannaschia sp. GRR-S6-38]
MIAATALAGALALPARADAPEACLSPADDIGALVAALEAEGWTALPQGDLPPEAADRLAWPFVAAYVLSDSGGQTIAQLYELQRRTVEGLTRRRDVPGSAIRLLTRSDGAMMVTVRDVAGGVELRCRVALDGGARAPVTFLAEIPRRGEGIEIVTTRLNPEKLSGVIDAPVTVAEIVETRLTYDPEDGS